MRKALPARFNKISQPQQLPIDIKLTRKEYRNLRWGIRPLQMEDKWLVFAKGNVIHFVRTWTSNEIYRAEITPKNDGTYLIDSFLHETDNRIYKFQEGDNEGEARRFEAFVNRLKDRKINDPVRGAILGHLVGDALGVPVEFKDREELLAHPVVDMRGYGTHNQPPGTWSDDGSMMLCTLEALCEGYSLDRIAQSFIKWHDEGFWTPHGEVFDIGISTQEAIARLKIGKRPEEAGGKDEYDNGNGSLMRILPLYFFLDKEKSPTKRAELIQSVSSITHSHARSVLACRYYIELLGVLERKQDYHYGHARELNKSDLDALNKREAFKGAGIREKEAFKRVFSNRIATLPAEAIRGSGYVVHTLEASIWCMLHSSSYEEAVLKAVNLGEDTDTTAAVTGSLAGLFYGEESIPETWISQLARIDEIEALIERFSDSLYENERF